MSVTVSADRALRTDGVMEIHYRMRFWKILAEIAESAKPLIVKAIKEAITRER